MKKLFSTRWKSSKQPRKQRKYRYNAPLHIRQKLVSSHLSPDLRKLYTRRALPLRRGDEVLVVRGEHKGRKGKVGRINLKTLKVFVENIKRKKANGQEVYIPLDPSNLMIINTNMDDKKRLKIVRRKPMKEEKSNETKGEKK